MEKALGSIFLFMCLFLCACATTPTATTIPPTDPKQLDEAALIDGASRWQVFLHISYPLVRPVPVVIGILIFISIYGGLHSCLHLADQD